MTPTQVNAITTADIIQRDLGIARGIKYARQIAAVAGPLAEEYRAAERILLQRARAEGIRRAEGFEETEMLKCVAHSMGQQIEDLPGADCYIVPNYMTDGPGYIGPVGFVHWHGAPHLLTVLTVVNGGHDWAVSNGEGRP